MVDKAKSITKIVAFGFFVWLIPFLISFLFYSPDGNVVIDVFLFKTIMMVLSTGVAAFFMVIFFKSVDGCYLKQGLLLGFVWFAINLSLDLFILLSISQMTLDSYIAQIGLRYLTMPIMSTALAYIVQHKDQTKNNEC